MPLINSRFLAINTRPRIRYDPGNGTALGVVSGGTLATAGTISHVGPSVADPVRRTQWLAGATAGNTGGIRLNHNALFRQLGFDFWQRVSWINATQLQLQMGLLPTAILGGEPSATLNQCAIGFDSTDTNLQLMLNDGSGTAAKTNLGIARGSPVVLDFYVSCAPGENSLSIRVENTLTGALVHSSNPTTKLPGATTALAICQQCRNVIGAGGQGSVAVAMYEGRTRI